VNERRERTVGRLDTFASQRTFRVLLEALAHPGRIVTLPTEARPTEARPTEALLVESSAADRPPALVVPLALADREEHVAVVGGAAERWSQDLVTATSCGLADPAYADQVVVLDGADAELVGSLRVGTPLAPEQGCRLVLSATALGARLRRDPRLDDPGTSIHPVTTLTLRGPGVETSATVEVGGIDPGVFAALAAANAAFPAGIDTFVVSAAGQVIGLPRSCTIDIEGAP
jgi:alpha-D-ribose 1-methylphosphonate 5-triphosphate synthase subunit PhnH